MTDAIQTVPEVKDPRELALLKAVGLDRADPAQRELALNIAKRYDLDLLLKHLVLIDGRPYVTRDGLLHVAHRSGQLDGIETTEPHLVDGYWRASCSVYRKDMGRPFTYIGRYPEKGKNVAFAPEMAVKVAEVMSLRRAFDVAAPAYEERWDIPEGAAEPAPPKQSLADVAAAKAASVQDAPRPPDPPQTPAVEPPPPVEPLGLEGGRDEPPIPEAMSRDQFKAFTSSRFIGASMAFKAARAEWPDFTWDSATPEQLADLATLLVSQQEAAPVDAA